MKRVGLAFVAVSAYQLLRNQAHRGWQQQRRVSVGSSSGFTSFPFNIMTTMKEDLKLLLTRNGVHADVVAWLTASPQDCHDIKNFANIVDAANQLITAVLQHTSQKDNIGQLALKQAWKEVEGINQLKLKRIAQGIAEDSLDEALDPETRKSKYATFQSFYQWTLKSREMVCDPLWSHSSGVRGRATNHVCCLANAKPCHLPTLPANKEASHFRFSFTQCLAR